MKTTKSRKKEKRDKRYSKKYRKENKEKIKVKEAPKNWSCDGTARVTVDIK